MYNHPAHTSIKAFRTSAKSETDGATLLFGVSAFRAEQAAWKASAAGWVAAAAAAGMRRRASIMQVACIHQKHPRFRSQSRSRTAIVH